MVEKQSFVYFLGKSQKFLHVFNGKQRRKMAEKTWKLLK